jgi:hypothetical protein
MLLAELAESDATGEIATIYAEMRSLGGVPMVALIFRHLATLPGALEWLWTAIGPAWRSGAVQERAWGIARETPMRALAPIPRAALVPLGLDAEAESAVRDVLLAYNRANPENMLTVQCVLRLLAGQAASRPFVVRAWVPPQSPRALLPMVDPATASAEITALYDTVAAPGGEGGVRVVQSLYRHLAQKPAFLALAVTLLRERFDDGSIDTAVDAVRDAMGKAADEIVASLHAPPVPHPGIAVVCERFGGGVIPQMIVAGALLERALP